jgi:hypothetical protein
MFDKKELLSGTEYLLTHYQIDIYRHLASYMEDNNITKEQVCEKLKCSKNFINNILSGYTNLKLEELIRLGVLIGKVPYIEFVKPDEYWSIQEQKLYGDGK